MKEIQLSQGYVALVDDEDYEVCMAGPKWSAEVRRHKDGSIRTVYAIRHTPGKTPPGEMLHRFLEGKIGLQVDHRDGDGLNNQRKNLRTASVTQNHRNQKKTRGTSRFKGVYWDASRGKWLSHIVIDKKTINLGRFSEETEAGRAYDAAAIKYFGEFALTNEGRY